MLNGKEAQEKSLVIDEPSITEQQIGNTGGTKEEQREITEEETIVKETEEMAEQNDNEDIMIEEEIEESNVEEGLASS